MGLSDGGPRKEKEAMTAKSNRAVEIQREYYTDSASRYDTMHAHEGATDPGSTRFFHAFLQMVGARSVLDVGTATGLSMSALKRALPELFVCGVEPVAALISQGVSDGSTSEIFMVRASGETLPFAGSSFDVVCEFGILHHVPDPSAVISEMLRVARKAVFISDSNRFGQGARVIRLIKLALFKMGLWRVFNYLKTAGRGYSVTEGDGLAYSYSVYDSLGLISSWADRVILIPATNEKAVSWLHPLLNSSGVIVCALRNDL